MFETLAAAAAYVREHNLRMVDLKYGDISGRWRHVTLSAAEFTPDRMAAGVGISGSNAGFGKTSGDLLLIPDPSTGFIDPFWDGPMLSFICDLAEPASQAPLTSDPRQVARRAEEYLNTSGLATCSLWGPEFEFYIFSGVSFENGPNASGYRVDSGEANWPSTPAKTGQPVGLSQGYHAIPPGDQFYRLRSGMTTFLEDMGVSVKYHHPESGVLGQQEIEIALLPLLKAADAILLTKYVTKMAAHQAGQVVTFLPKPLFGASGSGMHFHQQLFDRKRNLFYDTAGENHLSQAARYYIGGLLTHAPALMALTNPSTNSYRRLEPGFNAPTGRYYSSSQRRAAVRIPAYAQSPEDVRFEFRPPDATCNPYLAMAAMLLAGMHGIQNRIDPTSAGFGPFETDETSQATHVKSLPTSLKDVLDALADDHQFLLQGEVFNESLIQEWIQARRQEMRDVDAHPNPYEVQLYFDI
jgi:glutamine synthetase